MSTAVAVSITLPTCLFENSYRPVSLLEVLKSNAAAFARAIGQLGTLRAVVGMATEIPSSTFNEYQAGTFEALARALIELKLYAQGEIAKDCAACIRTHGKLPSAETLGKLSALIFHDLEGVVFIPIGNDRAFMFESDAPLFGVDVHKAFFSANFDISEAGSCFSLRRWNACVYHLMRALEIPLSCLANRFGKESDRANWQTILDQIEKEVRAIPNAPNRGPDWKEDLEFYSQACSQFMLFKDAWRNYTAHARSGKYDERDATLIMNSVKSFMERLATRLHEVT